MKPLPLKTPTPPCPLRHKAKAEVLVCAGRQNEKANSCTCTDTCSAGLGNSLRCKSIHNVALGGLFQCSLMNCHGQTSTQRSRLHNCIRIIHQQVLVRQRAGRGGGLVNQNEHWASWSMWLLVVFSIVTNTAGRLHHTRPTTELPDAQIPLFQLLLNTTTDRPRNIRSSVTTFSKTRLWVSWLLLLFTST